MGYDMSESRLQEFLALRSFAVVSSLDLAGRPVSRPAPVLQHGEDLYVTFDATDPVVELLRGGPQCSVVVYDNLSPASYVSVDAVARPLAEEDWTGPRVAAQSAHFAFSLANRLTSDATQIVDGAGDAAHRQVGKGYWRA